MYIHFYSNVNLIYFTVKNCIEIFSSEYLNNIINFKKLLIIIKQKILKL